MWRVLSPCVPFVLVIVEITNLMCSIIIIVIYYIKAQGESLTHWLTFADWFFGSVLYIYYIKAKAHWAYKYILMS